MPNETNILPNVSAAGLKALADAVLAPKMHAKLDDLLARNADGTLASEELEELDTIIEQIDELNLLKARTLLRRGQALFSVFAIDWIGSYKRFSIHRWSDQCRFQLESTSPGQAIISPPVAFVLAFYFMILSKNQSNGRMDYSPSRSSRATIRMRPVVA